MNLRASFAGGLRPATLILVAAALLGVRALGAEGTKPLAPIAPSARPATNFDGFRLVIDRNIFDPNRIGRTPGSVDTPPRSDTITLVGTMHYEKGLFAFFDGSNASFQKSLHAGETIAEYTVVRIGNDGVDLLRDGRPFPLTIGQQFQRPAGGDWAITSREVARSDAGATPSAAATATPAIPSDASDTLKRLMEQRQKQLKP